MTTETIGVTLVLLVVLLCVFRVAQAARGGKSHEELEMDQERDFFDRLERKFSQPQRPRLRVRKVWSVEPDHEIVVEGRPVNFWTDPAGVAHVSVRQDDGLVVSTAYYYPPTTPGWSGGHGETIIEVRYV